MEDRHERVVSASLLALGLLLDVLVAAAAEGAAPALSQSPPAMDPALDTLTLPTTLLVMGISSTTPHVLHPCICT